MITKIHAELKKGMIELDNLVIRFFFEPDTRKHFRALGEYMPTIDGLKYCLYGHWETDPKYGMQFRVEKFEPESDGNYDDVVSILKHLDGIGNKMADRIYQRFREKTLDVLEHDPERFKAVPGMTKAVYGKMIESYRAQSDLLAIYNTLHPYGIGYSSSLKIQRKYGKEAIPSIRKAPYELCEIEGISFKNIDQYALTELHIAKDDSNRIVYAALYVLMENELEGHTIMPEQAFRLHHFRLTGVGVEKSHQVIEAATEKIVHLETHGERFYARRMCYRAEYSIKYYLNAAVVRAELEGPMPVNQKLLKKVCNKSGIKLSDEQEVAVEMAIRNPISIITGGPGTGKTTILKIVAEMLRLGSYKEVVGLAFTGVAARNLEKKTGIDSCTIHSYLGLGDPDAAAKPERSSGIYNTALIIDEVSMIDVYLLSSLLKHVQDGCIVVFAGDPAQLQSIGPGAVLRDMLSSKLIPRAHLTEVFRQQEGSGIANTAEMIRQGNTDITSQGNFYVYDGLSGKDLENEMVAAFLMGAKNFGLENVCCISPVRDYSAGVNALNDRIREQVNPKLPFMGEVSIGGTAYHQGDRVMELQNNSVASNGDIGTVVDVSEKDKTVTVRFQNGGTITYGKKDSDRLCLAYAMTVHKSQGNEYKCVITCLQDVNRRMAKRSVIYTAITRGRQFVLFMGSLRALVSAVSVDDSLDRKTLLASFLRDEVTRLNRPATSITR